MSVSFFGTSQPNSLKQRLFSPRLCGSAEWLFCWVGLAYLSWAPARWCSQLAGQLVAACSMMASLSCLAASTGGSEKQDCLGCVSHTASGRLAELLPIVVSASSGGSWKPLEAFAWCLCSLTSAGLFFRPKQSHRYPRFTGEGNRLPLSGRSYKIQSHFCYLSKVVSPISHSMTGSQSLVTLYKQKKNGDIPTKLL